MLTTSRWFAVTGLFLVALSAALPARAQYDDPPERVARISDVQGGVGYSPAGEDVWLDVVRNRPLIRGDRLFTSRNARLEMQVGSAAIRLGPETSFEFLDLSDRMAQIEVTEGSINLSVRRLYRGQTIEVATPTLAFAISRAGRYRIDVDPRSNETTVVVWEGAGTAYGQYDNFPVAAGESVRFFSEDLSDNEIYGLPRSDAFDRYCFDRDQRLNRSLALRYVDDDIIGYSDLDDYGSWRSTRSYGMAWYPTQVASDWAPYRDGHWAWQEPWGWTWVDNAPWGFAPSHYGRWVHDGRWCWVPGPRNVRSVYAPALVAFVGGRNWSVSLNFADRSPVGWFPLGPREVYVPSYRASRDYFTRVNVNNTIINNTTIVNVYNNNYAGGGRGGYNMNYANRNVRGAVTAVPSDVFVNSRPVRGAALRIDERASASGEIARIAAVAPSQRSVLGVAPPSNVRPSREALSRQVVARTTPPPSERPFASRERQLRQDPGQPIAQPAAGARAGRGADARQNVRVLSEQRPTENARGGRGGRVEQPAAAGTPLPAWDRTDERGQPGRGQEDRGRGEQTPAPDVRTQDTRGQTDATTPRGERQRGVDPRQQQQQQEQQERESARNQRAAEQAAEQTQRAERQRDMDTRQQQQQQEQQERESARNQRAAEQAAEQTQRAERQRDMDMRQQQQQQEQQQRDAERNERAAEQQQRQAEQQEREAERDQRAAVQQSERAERERAVEETPREERRSRDDKEEDDDSNEGRGKSRRDRPDRGE